MVAAASTVKGPNVSPRPVVTRKDLTWAEVPMVRVQNPTDVTLVIDGSATSIHAASPSPAEDHSVAGLPSRAFLAPKPELSAPPPKLELTPATLAPFSKSARFTPRARSTKTAGEAKGLSWSTKN